MSDSSSSEDIKCVRQPMGSTKIGGLPRQIAAFLGLKDPEQYTGHCFRRTSATLLADSGADLITLKRHGGWKSSTVAEGYIEDSIENKSKICQGIVGGITLNQSCADPFVSDQCPSTSKVNISETHSKSPAGPSQSPTFTTVLESNDQCPHNLQNNSTYSSNKH